MVLLKLEALTSADIRGMIQSIHPVDIIDTLLVIYLVYKVLQLVRETRAMQLLKGLLLLMVLYMAVDLFELNTMRYLLEMVFQYGVIALLVVFQPELRRMLETVGRTRISNLNVFNIGHFDANTQKQQWNAAIGTICNAANTLARSKTGALMVLERTTKLGEIIKTGTVVDAIPSVELIGNLFFVNSPLHDGAMIIRDGKIFAAGCYLPLSDNHEISRELGTRHRAGLGMSENSDAVVIIVSEETGVISVAIKGVLTRNYNAESLAELLKTEILSDGAVSETSEKKESFWKSKKN
jgi:diadenylate cyclase